MQPPIPAWFILSAAAGLSAFAAQSTKNPSREIIGRLSAEPDVILDWNAAISDHFEESSLGNTPHTQARVFAMAHLGMRDAINATTREARHARSGAIAIAAANAAAHDILVALRPAGVNRFAALQARHGAAIANDATASHGRVIGQRIAASVLRSRAADGWPVAVSQSDSDAGTLDSLQTTVAKPAPFVLKRVQQFAPQPPYYVYSDGLIAPNRGLRNRKYLGVPPDTPPGAASGDLWRDDTIMRWNLAARSLAVNQPQDLHVRARVFASLNLALADVLLSATYWSESYGKGRMERPIDVLGPEEVVHLDADAHDVLSRPTGRWWSAIRSPGFPAIPAALAGAAEAILRSSFGDNAVFVLPANANIAGKQTDFTSLRTAARQCAWAALTDGASTPGACVAGYDLGSRIAGHVLKQTGPALIQFGTN